MTYREMMLQDGISEEELYTIESSIEFSKELLKQYNTPYRLKDGVEGPKTIIVFDKHFLDMFNTVNTNECMSRMSKVEKRVYWDWSAYETYTMTAADELIDENVAYNDIIDIPEDVLEARAKLLYEADTNTQTPEVVVKELSRQAAMNVLEYDVNACYDNMFEWIEE